MNQPDAVTFPGFPPVADNQGPRAASLAASAAGSAAGSAPVRRLESAPGPIWLLLLILIGFVAWIRSRW